MIDIKNVSKHYSSRGNRVIAVGNITHHIKPAEFVAVQGPSGCGKTTLLLTLGGLLKPTSGSLTVDGQDPYLLSPERRARFRASKIGFVFQQFHLVPYLSVEQNILVAAIAAPSDHARERANELIDHFQLTGRAKHVPAELSTGERQRVSLARALLNQPKLILADEPTGNLDQENAEIVLGYLAEFARQGGTVLLVTHDPRAAHYAHRTVHMSAGRVTTS